MGTMRGFGKRLVAAREAAGCRSILAGAKRCKLPHSSMSHYEKGIIPGGVNIAKICRGYDCSSDVLLGLPQRSAQ